MQCFYDAQFWCYSVQGFFMNLAEAISINLVRLSLSKKTNISGLY